MDKESLQFIVTAVSELDKKTQKKLDDILLKQEQMLIQTTKTNGRVNTLEDRQDETDETQKNQWKIITQLVSFKDQMKARDKVLWAVIGGIFVVLWYVAQNALTIKIK